MPVTNQAALRKHPDPTGPDRPPSPKIRGTRIGVELILERLGDGWSVDQLIESYPNITAEQIVVDDAKLVIANRP